MKHALLLALLLLTGSARAAGIVRVDLAGNPGLAEPEVDPGKDGIARIHKVAEASLELYPCAQRADVRGSVIVCPGGGYSILAVEHEGRAVARKLNECGYDAAVLLYHVSEGEKTRDLALQDAKGALSLVRKEGKRLGLQTKRIGVMGFSAGGHLAARVAHETIGEGPDFLVLMYPAYLEKDGVLKDEVAPPRIPSFVYTAGDDKFVPSARAFAAHCRAKNIGCDLHVPLSGGHGFGLKETLPEAVRDWMSVLCGFLAK